MQSLHFRWLHWSHFDFPYRFNKQDAPAGAKKKPSSISKLIE